MTTPKTKLPIGTVPPKTMNHSGITAARSVFFRLSCSSVVIAVAVMKYAKPSRKPTGYGRTESRSCEKTARTTAKPVNPRTISVWRCTSASQVPTEMAPKKAPSPHVAYSARYWLSSASNPKLSSAIDGNNPTNGKQNSENRNMPRRRRKSTCRSRTM